MGSVILMTATAVAFYEMFYNIDTYGTYGRCLVTKQVWEHEGGHGSIFWRNKWYTT